MGFVPARGSGKSYIEIQDDQETAMIPTTQAARDVNLDWRRQPGRDFLHRQGETDRKQAGKQEFPDGGGLGMMTMNDERKGLKPREYVPLRSHKEDLNSATRRNSTRF
jgi:hypothetical protein